MKWSNAYLFVLAFMPAILRSQTNTLIVPREAENAFGDSFADPFFFSEGLVQQVYAALEFNGLSNAVISITGLSFRLNDHPSAASMDAIVPAVRLEMGVFTGAMTQLGLDFHANLPDPYVVLDMENVHLKAAGGEPPSSFDVRFILQRPFVYDRRLGQLALNIWSGGGLGQVGGMDAHGVSFEEGFFLRREPGGISRASSRLMATKFSYTLLAAVINASLPTATKQRLASR